MLFIGLVGNIFYSGEIITLYAVFGALLVPLFRGKSWVLMTISLLLLLGTPRVIQVSYNTLVKTEQAEQKNATQTQAAKDAARDTKPSFLNSAKHNFTAGLQGKLNYQFGLFGRGYITFALFLAGLVVGRIRFFEKEQPVRKLLTLFIGFLCVVFLT